MALALLRPCVDEGVNDSPCHKSQETLHCRMQSTSTNKAEGSGDFTRKLPRLACSLVLLQVQCDGQTTATSYTGD
jgi:hypothetical protein